MLMRRRSSISFARLALTALALLALTAAPPAQKPSYDPALATSATLLKVIQAGETRDAIPCPAGRLTELWVLAGQSNMQGVGKDATWPHDPVAASTFVPPGVEVKAPEGTHLWMFNMDHRWMPAADPLHRHWASILPVHMRGHGEDPAIQAQRWSEMLGYPANETPRWVGPGLSFGKVLAENLQLPIGLIPTAHGGTTLAQWSPDLAPTSGTACLYGAMLERIRLARAGGKGGTLRGVLWYQGESDALPPNDPAQPYLHGAELAAAYRQKFLHLVDSLRRDTGIDDLPFITVQIGRFATTDPYGPDWEVVREVQRTIVSERPNLFVVSAIDLGLDDSIHISGPDQQRLGQRMALLALRGVYGRKDLPAGITLASVEDLGPEPATMGPAQVIRVRFDGVTKTLKCAGRPNGFVFRRPDGPVEGVSPHAVLIDPNDPTALLLHTQGVTSQTQLIYAPGLDPYVNLTDDDDMPVPAFGPVPVTGAK